MPILLIRLDTKQQQNNTLNTTWPVSVSVLVCLFVFGDADHNTLDMESL